MWDVRYEKWESGKKLKRKRRKEKWKDKVERNWGGYVERNSWKKLKRKRRKVKWKGTEGRHHLENLKFSVWVAGEIGGQSILSKIKKVEKLMWNGADLFFITLR